MKEEKVESVRALISVMEAKRTTAETDRCRLKAEMDQIMDEDDALEAQAKAKRRDAKDIYKQIDTLDYGDWVTDILQPLADELARWVGKKAKIFGPRGIGSKVTIALLDNPDRRWTEQDSLELTVEPDFYDGQLTIRYETGERNDRYKPGTVGYVNGLNNITAQLPDSVEEILALFRMRPAVNLTEKGDENDGGEG